MYQPGYKSLTLRYIFTNARPDTKIVIGICASHKENKRLFLTYEISRNFNRKKNKITVQKQK